MKTSEESRQRGVRVWMVVMAALAIVGLTGCDDTNGTGEGEGDTSADVCQGFGCESDGFFRDVDDTMTADTSVDTTEVDTTPADTAECSEGQFECIGTNELLTCVNGVWEDSLCIDPDVCSPEMGACVPSVCPVPGLVFGCEGDQQRKICGEDRLSFTAEDCANGGFCRGNGECLAMPCTAGAKECRTDGVYICKEDETGVELFQTCEVGETCSEGECVSVCEARAKGIASYEGCEYYVVDMDNEGDADDTEFGITISNGGNQVQGTPLPVDVVITGPNGFNQTVTVQPGGLQQVALPTDSDVDASGVYSNATFRVVAALPVSVHQFNPLNQSGVASNDASLLLPETSLGTDYIALGMPLTVPFEPQAGQEAQFYDLLRVYVDVVGTTNNTTVTVTSPVAVQGGTGFGNIPANVPTNITLNAGQLLHLTSMAERGADLSGLQIHATEPVAVFAGSRCGSVPDVTSYCDHMEQQLFPTTTWGTTYYATKFQPRGTESDLWRIVAREDGTVVTFDPPQNGFGSISLDRGEVYEMQTPEDFKITGDKPILVGQFMVGSNATGVPTHPSCTFPVNYDLLGGTCTSDFDCFFGGDACVQGVCAKFCSTDADCTADVATAECLPVGGQNVCAGATGIGDPAYSLSVPASQYRNEYIVMTPSGYEENYLTFITPVGLVPNLDSTPINTPPYNATPTSLNGERDVWRVRVGEGVHSITQGTSFGVMSYGYDCDVSYAYPGGLDLKIIN